MIYYIEAARDVVQDSGRARSLFSLLWGGQPARHGARTPADAKGSLRGHRGGKPLPVLVGTSRRAVRDIGGAWTPVSNYDKQQYMLRARLNRHSSVCLCVALQPLVVTL